MLLGDAQGSAVRQMAPAFAENALGSGVEGLSILLAASGIGATLSALWLAQGGSRRAAPSTILSAFLGFLVAIIALSLARGLLPACLAMMALACFFEICRTGTVALLQTSVPDGLRGRVLSSQFLLVRLAGTLGVATIGMAAADWGLRSPLLVSAALAFIVWVLIFRSRSQIVSAISDENPQHPQRGRLWICCRYLAAGLLGRGAYAGRGREWHSRIGI